MKPNYEDFKAACREANPSISCKQVEEIYDTVYPNDVSLACKTACPPKPKCKYSLTQAEVKEEGNNPMNYASATVTTPATEIQDQRKYLTKRLEEVYSSKRNPLEAAFGLVDDGAPQGPKEFADRLAAGQYTIRGLDKDPVQYQYWYWADLIQWRDPTRKADTEGFEAAKKALRAEKQKALDIIKIDEPKAGLEAIKALEAWEPTGKAS